VRVGEDRGIGNRLDETRTQYRSRDAKDDVTASPLTGQSIAGRPEIRLCDRAAAVHIAAAGDDEQVMDAAIGYAVGCDKAHFPDRAVWCDEPRHGVRRSVGLCDREQRIGGRTRSADEWLQMAGRALIRVVPRSQTGVVACCTEDDLDAIKARQPVLKESFLVGREAASGGGGPLSVAAGRTP